MGTIRKKGFEIGPGLMLFASRGANRLWTAWVEHDGRPIEASPGLPRVFEGDTPYQAQCRAVEWLRSEAAVGLFAPPVLEEKLPSTGAEHLKASFVLLELSV